MKFGTNGALLSFLVLCLCLGPSRALVAGPQVKHKMAHHRWFIVNGLQCVRLRPVRVSLEPKEAYSPLFSYDAALVSIEFDSGLYVDGTELAHLALPKLFEKSAILDFDCGGVGAYSPTRGGVVTPMILPSRRNDSMRTFFNVRDVWHPTLNTRVYSECDTITPSPLRTSSISSSLLKKWKASRKSTRGLA